LSTGRPEAPFWGGVELDRNLKRSPDILQTRGELDEALRIRRQDQLPIYKRLGEVREKAVMAL
jgi:hypothetical protein